MSQDDSVVIISSSPDFPSIDKLLAKKPKKAVLRSCSNAAPIPDNGLSTFTTAANLWQSLHGGGHTHNVESLDAATTNLVTKHFVTGLPRESEVKEREGEKKAQQGKRNAAPTTREKRAVKSTTSDVVPAEPTTETGTADSAPAPKPRRKPKATKDSSEGQTTIPKGKVTKAAPKEKATRKKGETVSRHFVNPAPPPKPVACVVYDEPIALEQAMRRRMDWTPPPEDSMVQSRGDSSIGNESSSTCVDHPEISQPPQKDVFKNLMGNYSHKIDEEQVDAPGVGGFVQTSNDILGKRKLIELVATRVNKATTPDTSPIKSKAPKKKPRTITDLATAAYRTIEEGDISTETETLKQDSLLDYFDVENAKDAIGKPKCKKAAKPKASKKKAEPRKQILLSPVSALRQVSGQDFVFGTASQLATEDDPDLLRALHEAMKASNQPDSDPFVSSPVISALASRRKVGNKLWAAGARDDDGDLLDLEPVDLTESPVGRQDYSLSLPIPRNPIAFAKDDVHQHPHPAAKVPIEILSSELDSFDLSGDEFLKPNPKPLSFSTRIIDNEKEKNKGPKKLSPLQPEESIQSNAVIDLDSEPPPSNQEHNQRMAQSQSQSHVSPPKTQVSLPKRPNFESFTDASLLKAVSAYGFKPLKKREAMIALLDQCWETKHKKPVGNVTAEATVSASAMSGAKPVAPVTAPARAKGRPKKASAVDVPTVDPLVSPSKPRGRPRKNSEVTSPHAADKPARGRPRKDSSKSPARSGKAKALSTSSKSISASKTSTAPPAASTTERRKVASASKAILEVADSDASDYDDPFLSSPVSLTENREVFSSSPHQPMDVSITEDSEDASLMATTSPTTQQAFLFNHIKKAVTTAPRATDPAEPSWHEKMLMYDPIILEDLATWLNSGQLDRVGYDGEVAPNDVKLWCQSQSICCLWRVNLHGKTRKRL